MFCAYCLDVLHPYKLTEEKQTNTNPTFLILCDKDGENPLKDQGPINVFNEELGAGILQLKFPLDMD